MFFRRFTSVQKMPQPFSMRTPQTLIQKRLRNSYERFWSKASKRIRAGKIELDPVLASRTVDRRRGLTLVARPPEKVRQAVASFLSELRRLEPGQYYYHPRELHLTVLSLFTATAEHQPYFAQADQYLAAVSASLTDARPIRIRFAGVTASPGTVMIQGIFENGELNELRDSLRRQLRSRGLGDGIDTRYRLQTAHMTAARFRAPLMRPELFAETLARARKRVFGAMAVRTLLLVKSDWYMSRSTTEVLRQFTT